MVTIAEAEKQVGTLEAQIAGRERQLKTQEAQLRKQFVPGTIESQLRLGSGQALKEAREQLATRQRVGLSDIFTAREELGTARGQVAERQKQIESVRAKRRAAERVIRIAKVERKIGLRKLSKSQQRAIASAEETLQFSLGPSARSELLFKGSLDISGFGTTTLTPLPSRIEPLQSLAPLTSVPSTTTFGKVDSISALGPSFTSKGFFTAEAEQRSRGTLDIGFGEAVILSGKAAIRERGKPGFISSVFAPFERVGLKKDLEEFPLRDAPGTTTGTIISEPGFIPQAFDPTRATFGRQREQRDIALGIPFLEAGLPLEVIATRRAGKISKGIQTDIDLGKIDLAQGELLFQQKFEQEFSPIFEVRRRETKPLLESGLGRKIQIGIVIGGSLGLGATPRGAAAVSGFVGASGVKHITTAFLGKDLTGTQRLKAGGIGLFETGLSVGFGVSGVRRAARGVDIAGLESISEKEFIKQAGIRLQGPSGQKGIDVLRGQRKFGGITEDIEIVSPFKQVGERTTRFGGTVKRDLQFTSFDTGELKTITQKFDVIGVGERRGFPITKRTDVLKEFQSFTGAADLRLTTQVESILPSGKLPKTGRIEVRRFNGKPERLNFLGTSRQVKDVFGVQKGGQAFITEAEFVQFAGLKPTGLVTKETIFRGKKGIDLIGVEPKLLSGSLKGGGTLRIVKLREPPSRGLPEGIFSTGGGGRLVSERVLKTPSPTSIFKIQEKIGTFPIQKPRTDLFKPTTRTVGIGVGTTQRELFKIPVSTIPPSFQQPQIGGGVLGLKIPTTKGGLTIGLDFRVKGRERLGVVSGLEFKQLPLEKTKLGLFSVSLPKQADLTKQLQSSALITKTQQRLKTQQQFQDAFTTQPPGRAPRTPRGPSDFAFFPVGFIPTLGGFGVRKRKKKGKKKPGRVAPSFTSSALDLRGPFPKVSKQFGISPFKLRLLPTSAPRQRPGLSLISRRRLQKTPRRKPVRKTKRKKR